MSLKILNILSAALLAGRLAMAASPASGDPLGRSVIAGGIAVYLGIMPAEVLPAHPGRYPRHEGSKIPAGKNVYHVLLALLTTRPGRASPTPTSLPRWRRWASPAPGSASMRPPSPAAMMRAEGGS